MRRTRVLVAMSGGVDSSVAAARLVDAGHDVVGITLHLWDAPDPLAAPSRCCAPEDQHDAQRAAAALGIPHYTFDRRELFRRHVVDPFVDAYLEGRTPSPCVSCNRSVKLRELLPLADRLGASHVATGHYARVLPDPAGRFRLHRGADRSKDQSYFLHMLDHEELARLLLPLGDSTKQEVRAEALRRDLPGATKGESQELCFVSSGRYDEFVAAHAEGRVRPGPVVDGDGRRVGEHGGVHGFTIGQRKGLGVALSRLSPRGQPAPRAFVVGIDAAAATVRLGGEADLLSSAARLVDACFSDDVTLPLEAEVRVRARHDGARATIDMTRDPRTGDACLMARFAAPVRAVSPGQVAVAYAGDRVLGGATIAEAVRA